MNMRSKLLILVVLSVVVVAAIFSFVQRSQKQQEPQLQSSASAQTAATEVSYKGKEGKNALELLKGAYKTQTKEYPGVGEFVTAIDGKTADDKHFWAFYVNGEQSQVGAGSYQTKEGDTIVWKLEEIK